MFSSTIIPTIGRDSLSRAVCSLLEQREVTTYFEVIVVNDSGRPLPEANWMRSEQVRIIKTQQRERCVARNVGAALARGRYLHFLDDDDWLLPGALSSLEQLAQTAPEAVWLYGGYHFVNGANQIMETWQPDEVGNCLVRLAAAEWLPIQASLIRRGAFFAVGGFELNMIPFQDNDLARQLALRGTMSSTDAVVASIVRNPASTTTDYSKLNQNLRWSNEKLLHHPNVFPRLRHSALTRPVNSAYWQGRITALYLNSTIWNLKQRRLTRALSRLYYAGLNTLFSSLVLLSSNYWQGALRPHTTEGFLCSRGVRSR